MTNDELLENIEQLNSCMLRGSYVAVDKNCVIEHLVKIYEHLLTQSNAQKQQTLIDWKNASNIKIGLTD